MFWAKFLTELLKTGFVIHEKKVGIMKNKSSQIKLIVGRVTKLARKNDINMAYHDSSKMLDSVFYNIFCVCSKHRIINWIKEVSWV